MDKKKKLLSVAVALTFACPGVLPSFLRAEPEPSQSAQNATPPSAGSSAESAPTSQPPANTPRAPAGATAKKVPGQIPLKIRHHAANTKFRYPFLGSVKAYAKSKILRLHTRAGILMEFPVKVFYSENGNFIRAEFVKPDAVDFQTPVKSLEATMRRSEEVVIGLPKRPLAISLESLLDRLHLRIEDATRFNVTYVLYQTSEEPSKPTIILNIFGADNILSYRFGDEERFRRTRVVMNQNGGVMFEDNLL